MSEPPPELPGRTVIHTFTRAELPANLPEPVSAAEPAIAVTMMRAKSVALELTNRPCYCRSDRGCELKVEFPGRTKIFVSDSWWKTLRLLFAYLHKRGLAPTAPKDEAQ